MIDPNKKEREEINPQDVCFRAFELMKTKQFEDAEKLLSNMLQRTEDDVALALYHSTLGVLFKMKGEFKNAWRHYERAEKFLPDDPALKIISARLLIDQFSEYSQAIKKAKQVLKIIPGNPVFVHQAHITMGLAYTKKGDKKGAEESLEKSMAMGFDNFITVANIDFHLVEALLKKTWAEGRCKAFLEKALALARTKKELEWINFLKKMLDAFPKAEADSSRPIKQDIDSEETIV